MPAAFNFSASPFDCLDAAERQLVRDHVDIAEFREGETVLGEGMAPAHLYVLIEGHVRQFEGEEPLAIYGPDDCFDGRALMAGRVSGRFVAADEVRAHRLDKDAVTRLICGNATFGALLFADLSGKLGAISGWQGQHEMQSLTMARVGQAVVRPAHFVDASTDIVSVVKLFQAQRTTHVLVRDTRSEPPRLGIFTTTGLQRAILGGTPLSQLPVGELANYALVTVRPGDHLFDALALMIRHKIHRVVVAEGGHIHGILEQLDLLSFLSNHSYLITRQILEARDLAEIGQAARQITRLIGILHRGGTRVGLIAQLVQELNAKLFERTWELIAPPELLANSCLFVMGSEGRGEQLLKTDQDNALVLRDGWQPPADLAAICERFSQALIDFGYPECPGGIMVRNPVWRLAATEFAQQVRRWLLVPDAQSLMRLAIFLDAQPVSGDTALLEHVRGQLLQLAVDNDAVLARFASAVQMFPEGGHWWSRLFSIGGQPPEQLDLKKAGLFPIVHGVRSLAFEQRVAATGTAARIEALVAAGRLPAELGTDLLDSLHFFMELRLRIGLDALETGRSAGSGIDLHQLGSLERDLLKDTLGVVKRFKALLQRHFRLDAL
ncbi:putative nucleotidyltransferase substrate binding domain-containing protein [Caldimonas tepidiphila]|uniref:putative nucleotidyltransferase substrate binding domain-containing protein n=1 Tax=Caldimonas tepidiphila TaxID=2315841 RepID=UPI000E5B1FDC|nr:putative nucleotidyltransferase substrate binding domain-containing protein [Caldimonas tepidiphila]